MKSHDEGTHPNMYYKCCFVDISGLSWWFWGCHSNSCYGKMFVFDFV